MGRHCAYAVAACAIGFGVPPFTIRPGLNSVLALLRSARPYISSTRSTPGTTFNAFANRGVTWNPPGMVISTA